MNTCYSLKKGLQQGNREWMMLNFVSSAYAKICHSFDSISANVLRLWSENFSPSDRSVLNPLIFQGLHNLHPARLFLERLRL